MRIVDLHNDAVTELAPKFFKRYVGEAKKAGVEDILISVWTTKMQNPYEQIQHYQQVIGNCKLHIEDAWFIDMQNIDEFIKLRPFSVGLTWNGENNLAGGANSNKGLSELGEAVTRHLDDNGIIIDLAHLNKPSFTAVSNLLLKRGRKLFCSHTCFNEVNKHPRNLDREQIRTIVDSDGLVGLTLVGDFLSASKYARVQDIYNHIKYFIENFGEDNLAIGTDFFGTRNLPTGICTYKDFGKLKKYLVKQGLCESTIDKIFYGNARRFLTTPSPSVPPLLKKGNFVEQDGLGTFDKSIIGYSVQNRPIHAFHVGKYDDNQIIITGAIHAREWITALLVSELVKIYAAEPIPGGIYFVPLCNPDGVELALTTPSPLWKANARGVDLNVNFDADWGMGTQNVRVAGPENYIGPYPNSEPEVQALIDFTLSVKPRITIAYHSKGEVIYYRSSRNRALANKIGKITGYTPEKTVGSGGGYSDWVSMHLKIPALTIEVGNDNYDHPIGRDKLPEILEQNRDVPRVLLDLLN